MWVPSAARPRPEVGLLCAGSFGCRRVIRGGAGVQVAAFPAFMGEKSASGGRQRLGCGLLRRLGVVRDHPNGVKQHSPGSPTKEAHPGFSAPTDDSTLKGLHNARRIALGHLARVVSRNLCNPFRVEAHKPNRRPRVRSLRPAPWAVLYDPFGVSRHPCRREFHTIRDVGRRREHLNHHERAPARGSFDAKESV